MSLTFISRRLSNLEDKIGAHLVDRNSGKLLLTDEGTLFYEWVAALLEAVGAAVTEVRALRGRIEGSLQVRAPKEICRRRIAGLCRQFSAVHPDVLIKLTLTDARPDVLHAGLDIAIVTKRPGEGNAFSAKSSRAWRVVCAAPAYIAAHGQPNKPEDLKHHKCILLRRRAQLYDRRTLRTGEGPTEIQVSRSLIVKGINIIHA